MAETRVSKDFPTSPKFHDFANFLGLTSEKDAKGVYWSGDAKTAKKMEEVYAWGKAASKSSDHVAVKTKIKQLQRRLGTNAQGKTLVDSLWQYTKMNTEMGFLKENIAAMEKKPQPSSWKKNHLKQHPKMKPQGLGDFIRESISQAVQQGIKSAFK